VTRTLLRIAVGGLAAALIVLAGGTLLRHAVLGADDAQAMEAIESEVRQTILGMALELRDLAQGGMLPGSVADAAAGRPAAAERLFAALAQRVENRAPVDAALSIYSPDGRRALAWAGRPTELFPEQLQRGEAWFLQRGAQGLRLVYTAAVQQDGERSGSVAAERPLIAQRNGPLPARGAQCPRNDAFCFPTRVGPVTIRLPPARADAASEDGSFSVTAPDGSLLFVAVANPDDLALTRARWIRATVSLAAVAVAVALLLMTGPLLDWRNHARVPRSYLTATALAALLLVAARWTALFASPADWTGARLFTGAAYASALLPRLFRSPFDFVTTWLTVAALIVLLFYAVESGRLRTGMRGERVAVTGRMALFLLAQLAAGVALAAILMAHQRLLADTIASTTLDLLHFSLQPWDLGRTSLQLGLLLAHATVVVAGVLALRLATMAWRIPRGDWRIQSAMIACWVVPLMLWQRAMLDTPRQQLPLLVAAAVCAVAALQATPLRTRFRHGSQAFRLSLLTLGLIVPTFAFYPTVFQLAGRAKAQMVETRYAPEAVTQRATLVTEVTQSVREIDELAGDLPRLLSALPVARTGLEIPTDAAFSIWERTSLALYPITSSVELYNADGNLVSRFAFNLPEALSAAPPPRSEEEACDWEVYGEVVKFFAEDRPVLHAGRKLCADDPGRATLGSIVVHAMLDYENLPFISSRAPYREMLRPLDALRAPGASEGQEAYGLNGQDVEFVFYGWSGRPLYPSGQPAWQLDTAVLDRLTATREPFWQQLRRGTSLFNVHLQSDRGGIYAVGFPVVTPLGHLVNLAEITVLAAGAYLALLLLNAVFGWVSRRATTAPALFREIRASFYRKLFLAFVAAVILPVAALAVVTRNYVAGDMRAAVESEALRTADIARKAAEDLSTQFNVGFDDNLMVWVSRLIDQDVNVYDGARLLATSERNLFASGSLSARAPADVYWALQLQNEAATVAHERIGARQEYLVAATPLTSMQPAGMLTVPLTSQQQYIENRIATLNRHMLLGALLFILAGAGLGYSMAERISDPVNRLTRATRRIARGDLDARIVARSSDELRRLVDDFNGMAQELRRQRRELERTHRVEAWAEMARQVAHEIKNPLTPIQLTAEHLRRVHADRGEPLSPVLQECVATILTQVRLLRQIASEFSSFASSPTARPSTVPVPELLTEVLEPYRTGLQDRITFASDVPAELPPVHVDRTLIARSLTNIIENALHAMPGEGRLTVVARAEAAAVRIRVTDTGAGMDAEALSRVFEPYFSTKSTGTGLGLTIARRNVELSGGTIAVSSERDRGTTVEITLPVASSTARLA
jgi:two-component system, NtrC family, nitrogen regulation sensor histidine kinase NtrY